MQRENSRSNGGIMVSRSETVLLVGFFRRAALGAVTADFESRNHDMEAAIPLNLSLQPVEQVAFKFRNLAAAQARHVDVISLGTALVVVLLALHVHQIEFVNQAVPFQ